MFYAFAMSSIRTFWNLHIFDKHTIIIKVGHTSILNNQSFGSGSVSDPYLYTEFQARDPGLQKA